MPRILPPCAEMLIEGRRSFGPNRSAWWICRAFFVLPYLPTPLSSLIGACCEKAPAVRCRWLCSLFGVIIALEIDSARPADAHPGNSLAVRFPQRDLLSTQVLRDLDLSRLTRPVPTVCVGIGTEVVVDLPCRVTCPC